jgi:hypothetical protein
LIVYGVNVLLLAASLTLAIVGLSWSILQVRSAKRLEGALKQAGAPARWQAWWMLRLRRAYRSVLPNLVFLLAMDLLFRSFLQVPPSIPQQFQPEFEHGLDHIRIEFERVLLLWGGSLIIWGAISYVIAWRGGQLNG